MRGRRRLTRLAWLALVGFVLVPAAAHAQGSITGVAQDASGAVLPGVTVEAASPALIEKVRAVVTDGSGQYRIVDLRPGTYSVTFTLPGFSVVKQEGVELTGSFTATVNAQLRVGTLAETITVTGASPTVDVQTVAQQRVLSKEVIDAVPAGRSHIDLAILIPGLSGTQPGRAGSVADVGGANNLQITWMSIHGSRQSDMRVMVDGVNIRNLANEGNSSNFVPDMGSTQEVTVDYAAGSAELTIDLATDVWIPGAGGAEGLPDYTYVAGAGCLQRDPTGSWMLNKAQELKKSDPAAAAAAMQAGASGEYSFRLLNAYNFGADPHNGHMMRVSGYLVRLGAEIRVNVQALQMVSASCGN